MKQLIDEYAGADTEIWIAESANLNTDTVSDKAKILFKTLLSAVTTKNKAYHVFTASDNKNMMYYNPKTVIHNNTYYPIEMHALAPNSGQMLEQTLLNQYIANNKSIVFYLCVGEAVFLFTGDTDNHTIAEMPRNLFLQHLHVVKIPHHGSQTSDLLIEDLQGGCDVACSTVYRMGRSYLPDNLVMDKYRSISSELYCTGAKEKVVEKENYGVVHIQTDIFSREYTTTTFGNAAIW
jgi:beta-lactamase superfamily II metal-dependent hydrolase